MGWDDLLCIALPWGMLPISCFSDEQQIRTEANFILPFLCLNLILHVTDIEECGESLKKKMFSF